MEPTVRAEGIVRRPGVLRAERSPHCGHNAKKNWKNVADKLEHNETENARPRPVVCDLNLQMNGLDVDKRERGCGRDVRVEHVTQYSPVL